jgi:hypothetical protein
VGLDLYAANGTTTLPGPGGANLPVLGYCSSSPCTVTAPGGPTLRVAAGSDVTITLHNDLSGEATSLYVGGQAMVPDRTPVTAGATHAYTFTATRPGTYLYEAGMISDDGVDKAGLQHQVARGLYGALVVEPGTAGQAYDATSTFDTEAVLVLSEVDPALNGAANPAAFDMRNFKPRWTLVNGAAAPATTPVAVGSGKTALLRYVNAGTMYHSMAVLGADQRIVAYDGSRLVNGPAASPTDISRRLVADTFGPGQTADALVTVPATAADRRLAVYDSSLSLHNTTAAGTGGMLTFLAVSGTGTGTDVSGPATSAVAWTSAALSASVDASAIPSGTVAAAEYFVDAVGAGGSGAAMEASDGAFGSAVEAVRPSTSGATALAAQLATGQHIVYVHGRSGAAWGPFSSVLVTGSDGVGPATSGVTVEPDHTNGSSALALSATANDTASGNSAIAAFEWSVDGGAATTVSASGSSAVAALDTTIPTSTLTPLAEGQHTVSVRARDAASATNWGAPATVTFVVDRTAPSTTVGSVTPNPNNGLIPVNGSTPAVRVSATIADVAPSGAPAAVSGIVKGEAYLDASTTPIPLEASDGAFGEPSEEVYVDIPLTTVRQLSEGAHTIRLRGLDAAGNWSPYANPPAVLTVDKSGPVISGLALSPDPTNGATSVTLTGTATDATGVGRVEWFIGADPGWGNATAATVHPDGTFQATVPVTSAMDVGSYAIQVRGIDSLGNRSAATASTSLQVTPLLWFSTLGSTNPPGVGGTADDADIYHWTGARFGRTTDVSVAPISLPSGVNVDGYDRVDATHFYLSFTGSVTLPGIAVTVQDEDVVYWNNGSWQLFYDGSARGNMTANVDAISVVGSGLYFSLSTTTVPNGAGGSGDDADVYFWTGGTATTYTRFIDATATTGFSTNASQTPNVDGFVWRSGTDWLMSFSDSTTTITGLTGTVFDEDVVRRTSGAWSKYFNGNAAGLTNNNQDVDAFDIP